MGTKRRKRKGFRTFLSSIYPDSKHKDALSVGEKYQNFIADQVNKQFGYSIHFYTSKLEQYWIGESVEGFEIKLDQRCTTTGRLSIEVGEKTRLGFLGFTPSGILRRDNTKFYVQGNYAVAWIFRKSDLQKLYKEEDFKIIENNPPTIQKFYLPIRRANQLAQKVMHFK